MRDILPNIEWIEAYVEGRLSREEQEEFEQSLEKDAGLREELELYQKVRGGLQEGTGELSELSEKQLRGIMEEYDRDHPPRDPERDQAREEPKKSRPGKALVYGAIAAGFALLIGTFLWWDSTSPYEAIAAEHYPKDPGLPVLMDGSSAPLDKVMNLYKQERYRKAYQELSKLRKAQRSNDTLRYYHGVLAYLLDRNDEALDNFRSVVRSGSPPLKAEAEIRLAFTYLKSESLTKSRRKFSMIAEKEGHPYREEAKEVLEKLRERSLIPSEEQESGKE